MSGDFNTTHYFPYDYDNVGLATVSGTVLVSTITVVGDVFYPSRNQGDISEGTLLVGG